MRDPFKPLDSLALTRKCEKLEARIEELETAKSIQGIALNVFIDRIRAVEDRQNGPCSECKKPVDIWYLTHCDKCIEIQNKTNSKGE